jgi:hypothetical protein
MRDVLEPRARLGLLLVQNGADHHARQEGWADAVAALARAAAPSRVEAASLAGFAARARDAASGRDLPVVEGELRDSYGYTWTLQGTFGTRAAQKRRVARATRRLVRDVEPWLALARLLGRERASDAALLHAAWRPLLRCLPHDTLCGCSTDAVARAMDARLDDADAQGRGLRDDLQAALVGHDPVAARGRRDDWRPRVELRNRAARARGGVAELSLATRVRDVGVGPGSARAWRAVHEGPTAVPASVQVLERVRRHDRLESPRHYPDDDLVDDVRALAWVPAVSGYGVAALAVDAPAGGGPAHPVAVADRRVANGRVTVAADARGRVRLEFHEAGVTLDDCVGFEDVGDAGDTYTPSPVGAPRAALWCAGGARAAPRAAARRARAGLPHARAGRADARPRRLLAPVPRRARAPRAAAARHALPRRRRGLGASRGARGEPRARPPPAPRAAHGRRVARGARRRRLRPGGPHARSRSTRRTGRWSRRRRRRRCTAG